MIHEVIASIPFEKRLLTRELPLRCGTISHDEKACIGNVFFWPVFILNQTTQRGVLLSMLEQKSSQEGTMQKKPVIEQGTLFDKKELARLARTCEDWERSE